MRRISRQWRKSLLDGAENASFAPQTSARVQGDVDAHHEPEVSGHGRDLGWQHHVRLDLTCDSSGFEAPKDLEPTLLASFYLSQFFPPASCLSETPTPGRASCVTRHETRCRARSG